MSQQHPISEFTASVMSNLRSLIDVNTIIGDAITTAEGVVIIPVSKVTFGYGSTGSDLPTNKPSQFAGGTGGGVTIQPLAFLVIHGERVELMQMQTADNTADRIVNSVPGVLDKLLDMLPQKGKDKRRDSRDEEDSDR